MHKLLFRISLIKFTAAKLVVDTVKTFEYRINTFILGETEQEDIIARQILDFFAEDNAGTGMKFSQMILGILNRLLCTTGRIFGKRVCFLLQHGLYNEISYRKPNTLSWLFLEGAEMIKDKVNGNPGTYKLLHHYIYFTPGEADVEIYFKKISVTNIWISMYRGTISINWLKATKRSKSL